jgi:hypothetical protein
MTRAAITTTMRSQSGNFIETMFFMEAMPRPSRC